MRKYAFMVLPTLLIVGSTSCVEGPSHLADLDPRVAPSEIAWRTFAQISKADHSGAAGWESWIDRNTLLNSTSSDPTEATCEAEYKTLKQLDISLETTELAAIAALSARESKKPVRSFIPPDSGSNMEIRFNSVLCKSVVSQYLWLPVGVIYAAHKRQDVGLPDGSIAVKAYWDAPKPNTPCDGNYHCYVEDQGTQTTIRLVALHMAVNSELVLGQLGTREPNCDAGVLKGRPMLPGRFRLFEAHLLRGHLEQSSRRSNERVEGGPQERWSRRGMASLSFGWYAERLPGSPTPDIPGQHCDRRRFCPRHIVHLMPRASHRRHPRGLPEHVHLRVRTCEWGPSGILVYWPRLPCGLRSNRRTGTKLVPGICATKLHMVSHPRWAHGM